jgi:hypothetical protein
LVTTENQAEALASDGKIVVLMTTASQSREVAGAVDRDRAQGLKGPYTSLMPDHLFDEELPGRPC